MSEGNICIGTKEWYNYTVSNQWFLFTGENAFELNQEKRRWFSNFAEKYGRENITELNAKSLKTPQLRDEIAASPFIAEKRLVILDGLPSVEKDDVEPLLNAAHEQAIVLCIEAKPDKRFASTKAFLAHMTVREFLPKSEEQLITWLSSLAKERDVGLPRNAALALIGRVGEDQYMLNSEFQKIVTHTGAGGVVTPEDIENLVVLGAERAVWQLMDLFVRGDRRSVLGLARDILEKGETPYGLWSRLLWMVSQLVLLDAGCQGRQANIASVSKETGVPFPTARTLFPFVRNAGTQRIAAVSGWFADADVDLKTGRYKATAEAPDELQALLDCGLLKLCALAK